MADYLINNRIGSEKQYLYLKRTRVVGVQSLSMAHSLGLGDVNYLGAGYNNINFSPQSQQSTQCSINSYLLNEDFFISYVTGTQLVNAYVLRDNTDLTTCYSLLSGYFTDYRCDYSIGNVPSINANFIALQNAGVIQTGSMTNDQIVDLLDISDQNTDVSSLLVPYGNSVTLNIDEFNTNRVQSFAIEISTNKVPIYKMGSKYPKRIDLNGPIEVECSFNFEQGDYVPIQLRDVPQNNVVKNLNLTIKDYNTDSTITSYTFQNLNLVNENVGVNVNNDVVINQTYRGIINNFAPEPPPTPIIDILTFTVDYVPPEFGFFYMILTWDDIDTTYYPLSEAEIQYRLNGGSWISADTVPGDDLGWQTSPITLGDGDIYDVRMRYINQSLGIIGEWSPISSYETNL